MRPTDRFTRTHRNAMRERIDGQRQRIAAAAKLLSSGRIIPDPADLAIGRGRRIEAAILFLDISGFTERPAETADEQDLQVRVLSLFFTEIIRVVGEYGGTVEKNTGDGVMAYFTGSNPLFGDVRQRATAAAMTMFYAVDKFINPVLLLTGTAPVDFRICIDHGWVTIARLGAARRFNHIVAIGTTANRTCKMLSFAAPNEILVGDAMLAGLPHDWLQNHVELKTAATGWHYSDTHAPYSFWTFRGRWLEPPL